VSTLKIEQARAISEIFLDLSNLVRLSDNDESGIAIDMVNDNPFLTNYKKIYSELFSVGYFSLASFAIFATFSSEIISNCFKSDLIWAILICCTSSLSSLAK